MQVIQLFIMESRKDCYAGYPVIPYQNYIVRAFLPYIQNFIGCVLCLPENSDSENMDCMDKGKKQTHHNMDYHRKKSEPSSKNYLTQLDSRQTSELTLARERTRQIVAVVHIDSARASSAATNLTLTFNQVKISSENIKKN